MGFSEIQAAQAFFACDKNEMLAANFLFENSESFRAEMEEDAQANLYHAHQPPQSGVPPEAKTEQKKEQKKEEG